MMSTLMNPRMLLRETDTRTLLLKWIVALLVPVLVFTLVWSGEEIINKSVLGLFFGKNTLDYDTFTLVLAPLFVILFFVLAILLAGYMVAADSGRRGIVEVWSDVTVYVTVPILMVVL